MVFPGACVSASDFFVLGDASGLVAGADATGGLLSAASFGAGLFAGAGALEVEGGVGLEGATLGLKAVESGEGILMLMSWSTGLGSVSSTIGNTTATAVTRTIAPIRRRRARFLS